MVKIASCTTTNYLLNKISDPELIQYKVELRNQKFSDGEMSVQYIESIRGNDLFLIGDTSQNLTELLLAIDGAIRSSCKSLTIILPYYGYGRQDKKEGHRGSLGASVMAHSLQSFGVNRVVSIDLHADQIQGMFHIPLEHIKGNSIFVDYMVKNIDLSNMILCSPDAGGVHRVQKYGGKLGLPMVSINKLRDKPNSIASMDLIGSVENKDVMIIDDCADTCNTLSKATDLLIEKGALKVYCFATHPILSGKAFEILEKSKIFKLIVSDTREFLLPEKLNGLIEVVSCVPVLERVIKNLINDESISEINQ